MMMSFLRKHLYALILVTLISVSFSASYYKYVILADFETIFYTECDPDTESCFVSDDSCTGDEPGENCVEYFKAVIVDQGEIDSMCTDWDTGCLQSFCTSAHCKTITCEDSRAEYYKISNACSNDASSTEE